MPTKYELCDFLLIRPDASDETIIKKISQILERDETEIRESAKRTVREMEWRIGQIKKLFKI